MERGLHEQKPGLASERAPAFNATRRLTAATRPDSAQGMKTLSRYSHDDNADFPAASPRASRMVTHC